MGYQELPHPAKCRGGVSEKQSVFRYGGTRKVWCSMSAVSLLRHTPDFGCEFLVRAGLVPAVHHQCDRRCIRRDTIHHRERLGTHRLLSGGNREPRSRAESDHRITGRLRERHHDSQARSADLHPAGRRNIIFTQRVETGALEFSADLHQLLGSGGRSLDAVPAELRLFFRPASDRS